MDYFEGVVLNYIRSDRSVFVNSECCIQLNEASNPDKSGPHWYCDAVCVDFRNKNILLCEISFSSSLSTLVSKLKDWNIYWDRLAFSLERDSNLPKGWPVRPWIFVPEIRIPLLLKRIKEFSENGTLNYTPLITPLELTQPWRFRSWNRLGEETKPDIIPVEMQK